MDEKQGISLPQLTNDIVKNARKTRLDAFAVALEGWRRGLTLTWYTKDSEHFNDMIIFGVNPPGRLFSLSSEQRTHYFFRTRGDKVTNEAVKIGSEKDDTKEWLDHAGVPVPQGKGFPAEATDETIIQYAEDIGFPLVLKPTNASLGKGVMINIETEQALIKALNYIRYQLGYGEVVVEQYVTGEEYRVYVIDGEVIAAYNRVPANIIGDGKHNIEELIELKNTERKRNARLNSCLIEMDHEIREFVQSTGYTLESIPTKGEQIFLRQKSNISSGGDPIDVTDDMPEHYKNVAVNALKAVPGLYHGGVDLIVNGDSAVVIELNPTAQIGGILFPMKGKARNIPGAIIDYYFPETKGMDTSGSQIYFDLLDILEPLENRSAIETEVAPAPMGKLHKKRFVVTGTVQRHNYHNWLKQQAMDRHLHGYVKNRVFDEIEIVVAGTNIENITAFKNNIDQYPQSSKITSIREENYDEPVMIGFEIADMYNTSNLKTAQFALRKMEKDLKHMTKQKHRIEKDNQQILDSTSWKFTEPLRRLGNLVKGHNNT